MKWLALAALPPFPQQNTVRFSFQASHSSRAMRSTVVSSNLLSTTAYSSM
jgi:hypothetical protein